MVDSASSTPSGGSSDSAVRIAQTGCSSHTTSSVAGSVALPCAAPLSSVAVVASASVVAVVASSLPRSELALPLPAVAAGPAFVVVA